MNLRQTLALLIALPLALICLIPLAVPEPGQFPREHTYNLGWGGTLWATPREIKAFTGLLVIVVLTPIVIALLGNRRRIE